MACLTPVAPLIVPPLVRFSMSHGEENSYRRNSRQEENLRESLDVKRILIVEDSPDGRLILEDMLLLLGYQVMSAANGLEALEALKRGPLPNLILLDLSMPEMNGWEFRERQKQDPAYAGIPVVVISAVATRNEVEHSNLDAAAFLDKPVPPAALVEIIRTLI